MEFISTPKALFFYSLKFFQTGGTIMKKLEIIIKPEKLENMKSILDDCKASGVMISNIMGYGNQRGYTQM